MEAKIKVRRLNYSSRTTIGELSINDKFFCYTLEDTVRGEGIKVDRETAIPAGTYQVKLTMSNRFKRLMPIVFTESDGSTLKAKGISFSGVRIHGGNTHENTEGCILVGFNKVDSATIQGTAEKELVKELQKYTKISIEVINVVV